MLNIFQEKTTKSALNYGDDWLLTAVGDQRVVNGLPANTARLLYCATQLRDRISLDNWHTVQRLAHAHEPAPQDIEAALSTLDRILPVCTALAGYAFDDMTRDDAWRFLVSGRRLERMIVLSFGGGPRAGVGRRRNGSSAGRASGNRQHHHYVPRALPTAARALAGARSSRP